MSQGCPRCQRPIAVARAQCLYCGAALDPSSIPAAPPAPPSPTAAAVQERSLVLVDTADVDAEALAFALGTAVAAAAARPNRGWQLHRVATPAEAEDEAARLRAAGLRIQCLPELDVRPALQPSVAEGGRRTSDGVELRTDAGTVRLEPPDVMLVVAGAIHRELQSAGLRRGRLARTLEPGYRLHLHRHGDPRPIEVDPAAFAFDEPRDAYTSSWLELQGWLLRLAPPGGVDEAFRFVPPALGVAGAEAPADITRALGVPRASRRRDAPAVLDNLAQFRFYSGWRAGALRGARG